MRHSISHFSQSSFPFSLPTRFSPPFMFRFSHSPLLYSSLILLFFSLFFTFSPLTLSGQKLRDPGPLKVTTEKLWDHGALQVTADGHYIQHSDGTPFFWLGDTAWELFHRLTPAEIGQYLDDRSAKGFNVIQAVILAEMDGLRKPNQQGEVPLTDLDPTRPNENYFALVDSVVRRAADRNMYMGLLPTWGDKVTQLWGTGPVVFNPENARKYGHWLASRYKNAPNIIWILGGDRPPKNDDGDWRPVWKAMAEGIEEAAGPEVLITYHPSGGSSSSRFLHNEKWLDLNMMQSGHGDGHDVPVWDRITADRLLVPAKPTLDGEPNYEDHPVSPWPVWNPENGHYRDHDVRKQLYRSVFAGACGVTYGHHSIWQFWNPREQKINHAEKVWNEALNRPGAFHAGILRRLMESRPLNDRIPDPSIIVAGQGEKGEYMTAFRDGKGRFLMVYFPVGKTATLDLSSLSGKKARLWWFNPRTGKKEASLRQTTGKKITLTPPSTGGTNDWVLIADSPKKNFKNNS